MLINFMPQQKTTQKNSNLTKQQLSFGIDTKHKKALAQLLNTHGLTIKSSLIIPEGKTKHTWVHAIFKKDTPELVKILDTAGNEINPLTASADQNNSYSYNKLIKSIPGDGTFSLNNGTTHIHYNFDKKG